MVQRLSRQDLERAPEASALLAALNLDDIRRALQDLRVLTSAVLLQDAAVALDLLHQVGVAERAFFAANVTILPGATATVVTLDPPSDWVGFWRRLEIEPYLSRIFTMVVTLDGQEELRDTQLVPREIVPERVWLPFHNNFQVQLTNNDPLGPQTANLLGTRVFLKRTAWEAIRQVLNRGMGLTLTR